MVIRRDSKVDAFQRQISALRQQLGGEHDAYALPNRDRRPATSSENSFRSDSAVTDDLERALSRSAPGATDRSAVSRAASSLPAVPAADTFTSVIAHTTSWNGSLESSGSLHVHGRVEGSLAAQDDVYIAEEADVDASITAANVTIAGNVRGSIHCAERLEVLPQGRVAGDVRAPVIVIHEGAMLVGEVSMAPATDVRASTLRAARGGD